MIEVEPNITYIVNITIDNNQASQFNLDSEIGYNTANTAGAYLYTTGIFRYMSISSNRKCSQNADFQVNYFTIPHSVDHRGLHFLQ